ncbi:hypothetical protein AAFF_G00417870 [Aldrovandia affinis]|uniref:Uncharacterized protein n=1 Tax=Aldrovandia affinis TaxID=143900 RepID=A0AAD7WK19_9TELE|nr:hypothetical protein AAFF_G00417870 [Aldrovandia affinis]
MEREQSPSLFPFPGVCQGLRPELCHVSTPARELCGNCYCNWPLGPRGLKDEPRLSSLSREGSLGQGPQRGHEAQPKLYTLSGALLTTPGPGFSGNRPESCLSQGWHSEKQGLALVPSW